MNGALLRQRVSTASAGKWAVLLTGLSLAACSDSNTSSASYPDTTPMVQSGDKDGAASDVSVGGTSIGNADGNSAASSTQK